MMGRRDRFWCVRRGGIWVKKGRVRGGMENAIVIGKIDLSSNVLYRNDDVWCYDGICTSD